MILEAAAVLALAAQCARAVAAPTTLAVVRTESGLNPYAIGVNHAAPLRQAPQSRAEAVALARRLLSAGANLDLGLTQINSANLARLGLSLEDAFDPCRNLAAGAALLADNYTAARRRTDAPQAALRIALSLYNTGDEGRGFRNGYVARVVRAAAQASNPRAAIAVSSRGPDPAVWDAFGDLRPAGFVVTVNASAPGAAP